MKKRKIRPLKSKGLLLSAFLLFCINWSFCQVEIDNLAWIFVTSQEAEQNTSNGFTNNQAINEALNNSNVTKYQRAFPAAQNPEILKIYEIECAACDIDILLNQLHQQFGNYYGESRKHYYSEISMYDPEDYLWQVYLSGGNDWLWHLDTIDAPEAWDITQGSPSVKVGILDTDFDVGHPDLATKITPHFDPYSGDPYDCDVFHGHGTSVAGYVAGETAETGTTPLGQSAAVGFNTMMTCYRAWVSSATYLQKAHHAALVENVKVLTSSAGGWTSCPDDTGMDELVVKEILDHGTTIIMPAGNGETGTHNECAAVDPDNHIPFFPLTPYYDERVIIVSSTGKDGKHAALNNAGTGSITHSHYPMVDLCSPGYRTFAAIPDDCGDGWGYANGANGTSFATPIVAGVAALMYDVNPCLSAAMTQDILKNTTDPILDAASFPNGVGTGRVNAHKAVRAAESTFTTGLDLYIKDRPEDFGDEEFPYHWAADRDESPDIWVRNQDDGFENQEHEEPEYHSMEPVYVYVKVRNKSCLNSTGNEKLALHWSKSGSWSGWPDHWDGTLPSIGNLIGLQTIPVIEAGDDLIIEFEWNIPSPYIFDNWSSCLMARIENSILDPITIHPDRLDDDIFFNNNVSLKNVTIIDFLPGIVGPPMVGNVQYPFGKYLYMGNAAGYAETFDFEFAVPDELAGNSLLQEAEVRLFFTPGLWNLIEQEAMNNQHVRILSPGVLMPLADKAVLKNITIPANMREEVYVGYNFLSQQSSTKQEFKYHVRQYFSSGNSPIGGEHFVVRKPVMRNLKADAGPDQYLLPTESITITAQDVGEPATYHWYDVQGNLLASNPSLTVYGPSAPTNYRLEVIADADGIKDYDDLTVYPKENYIQIVTPNPASNQVQVSCTTTNVNTASLAVLDANGTVLLQKQIGTNQQSTTQLQVSGLAAGVYDLTLICDGTPMDVKTLIIQ